MSDLTGITLGNRVTLLSKGYWYDANKKIWVNEGVRIDNNNKVSVYLFDPRADGKYVDYFTGKTEKEKRLEKFYSSSQEINGKTYPYVIFQQATEKRRQPTPVVPKSPQQSPQYKQPLSQQGSGRKSLYIIAGVIGVFFCVVSSVLFKPTIETLLYTKTPTSTATSTFTLTPTNTFTPTVTNTAILTPLVTSTHTFTPTLTLTPTTPPLPTFTPSPLKIFFSDNFDDAEKTTENWNQLSGVWDATQSTYTCSIENEPCLSVRTESVTDDFALSVDVQGNEKTDKAIYIGFVENQKYLTVLLRSDPLNQILVIKHVDGQPDVILDEAVFEMQNQVWYRVHITSSENTLAITINEKDVLNLLLESTADWQGSVGIGIPESSASGSAVSFDNFIIELLNELAPTPTPTLTPTP